jgi:hypothetical protein
MADMVIDLAPLSRTSIMKGASPAIWTVAATSRGASGKTRGGTRLEVNMTEWTIAPQSSQVHLSQGTGDVSFVVTNSGSVDDRAAFDISPDPGAEREWFIVDQPEQDVRRGESVTFSAKIQDVDPVLDAGAERYDFRCRGVVRSASLPGQDVMSQPVTITLYLVDVTGQSVDLDRGPGPAGPLIKTKEPSNLPSPKDGAGG